EATVALDLGDVPPRLDLPSHPADAVDRYLQRQAAKQPIALLPLTFMLLMLTVALSSGAILFQRETGFLNPLLHSLQKSTSANETKVALLNGRETTATAAFARATGVAFCDETGDRDGRTLSRGLATMRRTGEGNQLYNLLVTNRVCVGVQDVSFNGGFAMTVRDGNGTWLGSEIRLDTDLVESGDAEVLAAALVHEATHVARAVNGASCDIGGACTELPNGVAVEEEVAAHAAEARWWIDFHGSSTETSTSAYAADFNALAAAYQTSPATFRAYVIDFRSDSREGEGL
ncbi:MAG: hypothetical protein M3R06_08515, partial [Chloroflexota bacterium]|nr:hypothetical protein [Chloroflexota bacterium]